MYKFFNFGSNYYQEFTDRLEMKEWDAKDYYNEFKRVRRLLPTLPINQLASAHKYMQHCSSKRVLLLKNRK